MANTLIFTIDSITADRTQGVLLDGSTYISPVRSGGAVFVKGQKIKSDATVESTLTVTGNNANPATDSSWTFSIPKDGWFRFLIIFVPNFNSSATYTIYESVFEPGTGKVYRSKQNGNTQDTLTNTTWWEEITDPATLASNEGETNESDNIDSLIYEPGLFPNSEYSFAQQIGKASEEYLTSLNIPDDDLDQYSLLAVLIDGAYVKSDRSEMNQSDRIARRLESIFETLNS
jgi:hypothetical protein